MKIFLSKYGGILVGSLMVDEKDAEAVRDGGQSDYALGGPVSTFEPLNPDRLLRDKDTIQLGNTWLVMLHHPGHTKGSCSFLLEAKDNRKSYRVLIANMPTIVTEKDFREIPHCQRLCLYLECHEKAHI